MALAPAALAQLGAFFNAAVTGQVVTQTDLAIAIAPLTAQLTAQQAQLAALSGQVAALRGQVAALPSLAQIQAAIAAALAPHSAPAIAAAAAAATTRAIIAAREENNHSRSGVAYAVVPLADGTPPPSWPAGFDRAALRGPIGAINALLDDFGLAAPAAALDRRNALALHIGTACL